MAGPLDEAYSDARGRILLADSVSYCDERIRPLDVLVCGSFAGAEPIGGLGLPWGPRAVIAHACGVGKDGAGIGGLALCQRFGVPAAAIETMSARISDGRSAWDGSIGHVNEAAAALGVAVGQPVREAAKRLLDAPPGRPLDVGEAIDNREYELSRGAEGGIYAIWNLLLLHGQAERPNDVFCIAAHSGKVMAERSVVMRPKGLIANDGGMGKDGSGIDGLAILQQAAIPAAAVAAMSARIGDARSTYHDGVISASNEAATACGVRPGMAASEAARLLLARPRP